MSIITPQFLLQLYNQKPTKDISFPLPHKSRFMIPLAKDRYKLTVFRWGRLFGPISPISTYPVSKTEYFKQC